MGSYPGTVYYVDIFTLVSCKMCLKKTKNKRKSGLGIGEIFFKKASKFNFEKRVVLQDRIDSDYRVF